MNLASQDSNAASRTKQKLSRKDYEKELAKLQVKLCNLQDWVRETGARVVILFEGRDTAGKGGVIKRITERVSPRTFRVVALSAPTEREKKQLFMQRYVQHLPASGEVVIFDRSWYNRALVDRVMRFAPKQEVEAFLANIPTFEKYLVDAGVILIKMWLEVGKNEQDRRFHARVHDPLRQWKLSPMDRKSYERWYEYSRARDAMLRATDRPQTPWYILRSDDKRRARLNGIAHILSVIPYKRIKHERESLPKRSAKHRYKDDLDLRSLNLVREIY
ncbi:MAG TPA: polyphosphate kinase 2 [Terrimicrobiaceae bacterium]|nr:polyphosphate kinase 2 [Terrimicrobiaceae bacterium]